MEHICRRSGCACTDRTRSSLQFPAKSHGGACFQGCQTIYFLGFCAESPKVSSYFDTLNHSEKNSSMKKGHSWSSSGHFPPVVILQIKLHKVINCSGFQESNPIFPRSRRTLSMWKMGRNITETQHPIYFVKEGGLLCCDQLLFLPYRYLQWHSTAHPDFWNYVFPVS